MEVRNVPDNSIGNPSPPTSSKQPKPSPNPVDSNSVRQRLHKELTSLMMSEELGVSAFPENENIFSWVGTIKGSQGTTYEGLSYKLSLRFPLDYPFKPPQVKFETMCFHPNVDQYGNICLDILQDKWSSAYDCRTILLSIQSLLGGSACTELCFVELQNPILRALSTAMLRHCGIAKKTTRKWCINSTWMQEECLKANNLVGESFRASLKSLKIPGYLIMLPNENGQIILHNIQEYYPPGTSKSRMFFP